MQIMVQTYAQDITTDTTLANKYFETGKEYFNNKTYDTAAVNFEKASFLYEKHEQWRKYLLSETKHGECYQKQWQLDKAINTLKPAIEKSITEIGENDTIVADAYKILGIQYYYQSKVDSVLFCWEKTLNISKKLLGVKNKDVANSYNNIGAVYHNKSEYDKALQYYFKSLEIKKKLFGEKHVSVASSYNNIGVVYSDKLENDKALQYYFKSLEIRKEFLGERHIDVAGSYNNIGAVYIDKCEYDKALEYFFKSLEIRKELFGEKHIDVATSYNNIGIVYQRKSEYDKALEYNFKSLEIFKELLGEKHVSVASSYVNIGITYLYIGEYNKALEYYFKSLDIYKVLLGEKHVYLASTYNNIGKVYAKNYEYNSALRFYQQGVASVLRNFNDTTNITSIPVIKDYLDWNWLLQNLQAKAEIFADTTKKINVETLHETSLQNRQQIALLHYQACDTLISQVRQNISTKSDKLALGERASEVYKGAIEVCIDLQASARPSSVTPYKEQAFYFSERNKSSVLLEALAGAEALQYAGIPDTLLQIEHDLSIDIANYKNLKNNETNDSIANIWSNRLFAANRSYDSLIVIFETQYPEYYNLKYNNTPATVEQVSNLLDKKTAMLSYFVGDSIITIFAISKKDFLVTQVSIVETLHATSLQEAISDYRFYISETDLLQNEVTLGTHESVDLYQELAVQFYNLLFPSEIQEFLKGGMFYDIENLIIIPDGQLATLPFETGVLIIGKIVSTSFKI